ncbi:transmembrane protein, putative [Bodo saltans]|uniref:Transmembrane protein, putative n=1 Tax=Bodo saltans TaxID=75058 RepID=A0A0S4IQG7_BODSA|nr:transmembrane protein, putative [Bodo saltans]|eukprot:CUE62171.1 transmembrane protein, putative [Bodo saltans]
MHCELSSAAEPLLSPLPFHNTKKRREVEPVEKVWVAPTTFTNPPSSACHSLFSLLAVEIPPPLHESPQIKLFFFCFFCVVCSFLFARSGFFEFSFSCFGELASREVNHQRRR